MAPVTITRTPPPKFHRFKLLLLLCLCVALQLYFLRSTQDLLVVQHPPHEDRSDERFVPNHDSAEKDHSTEQMFDAALSKTTSMLYRHSAELDYWMAQPAPAVYVYDHISAEYSDVANVSACVDRRHGTGPDDGKDSRREPFPPWNNCRWQPSICENTHAPRSPKQEEFLSHKNNYNQDVAYLERFENTYPYKTTDPSQADLFLVPFPIKSFCLCRKDFKKHKPRCMADFDQIQRNVMDKLTHRRNHSSKHVFLYGADQWMDKRLDRLTEAGLSISLGPVKKSKSGWIAVPYISSSAMVQPRTIYDRPREWWTRDRRFALGAAFGTPKKLIDRRKFIQHPEQHVGISIAGKNNSIHDLGLGRTAFFNFGQLYRNSTFCLVLAGDNCPQKRFFEVILNGCIPILPTYGPHYARGGCHVESTYPFSKGSMLPGDGGVDMTNIILTYDGKDCGFPCLREPMERLLSNQTALHEHQLRLREYAMLSSFGFSNESYGYPDAFMGTIVALRHKIWHRTGKLRG